MEGGYLAESVTRDLMYLYNYLKSDDKSDITFSEPWYIEDYFDSHDIEITSNEFNEYMEDNEWAYAVDWLYSNNRDIFEDLTKWIVESHHDESQVGYTKLYFDNDPKLLKNEWLLHFTDNAYDVFREGFNFGTYDMRELGLTTRRRSEAGGTFAFAYQAKGANLRTYGGGRGRDFKYGQQVIMFRASGVKVYHNTDEEYQVIFDTRTVTDLVVLERTEYNNAEVWAITDRNDRPLYKTVDSEVGTLENIIKWVINNYDAYRKSVYTGAAPSVKYPSKHKKKFESALESLGGDADVVKAMKSAYDLLFK